MKTTQIIIISMLCLLGHSCKKGPIEPTEPEKPVPVRKSQMTLLCSEWVLKETYTDDQLTTDNGTGQYRFEKDGKFLFKEKGIWKEIATFQFNDQDSNSISVNFVGMTGPGYWWDIKKLDEKNYNTEFTAGGKKLNYNYVK